MCAAFRHDPDVPFTVGQNKNPKQQQTAGYYLTGNHAIHFINCIKHLFASQCMHTFCTEVKVISIKCNLNTHCARAHQKITYPCDLEMEKEMTNPQWKQSFYLNTHTPFIQLSKIKQINRSEHRVYRAMYVIMYVWFRQVIDLWRE